MHSRSRSRGSTRYLAARLMAKRSCFLRSFSMAMSVNRLRSHGGNTQSLNFGLNGFDDFIELARINLTVGARARGRFASENRGYREVNRSVGGAISVTRSRTSFLLESGASCISRGCKRAVQA